MLGLISALRSIRKPRHILRADASCSFRVHIAAGSDELNAGGDDAGFREVCAAEDEVPAGEAREVAHFVDEVTVAVLVEEEEVFVLGVVEEVVGGGVDGGEPAHTIGGGVRVRGV